MHLVESTLSGLDERDAVLRIALRLVETTDLRAHLLGDGEPGGVVRGTVDAVARRQLLHRLGSLGRRAGQLTMGVERLNVVLDTKPHCLITPVGRIGDGRLLVAAARVDRPAISNL